MTIKQYQKLAATIANKIIELGGNPRNVRHLTTTTSYICVVEARDPKQYANVPCSYESGNHNVEIKFNIISNPNNPNYKYRTLKPGSMSMYDSKSNVNVDITDYNFDSVQFSNLICYINNCDWTMC